MAVEIGELQVNVGVGDRRSEGTAPAPGAPASPQAQGVLREALRPIVQQIVEEELRRLLREGR